MAQSRFHARREVVCQPEILMVNVLRASCFARQGRLSADMGVCMKALSATAFVIGLALAGAAHANNIVLNETVDISTAESPNMPTFFGWRDFTSTGGAFSPDFSYQLSAGDSLDFTATFLPGQSLTLTNANTFWLFSYATDGQMSGVNGTGSLTLLDTAGNPLYTSNVKTDDEGSVHFGQSFNPADFPSIPNTVTIGGLHYVGTLNSYDDPTVTTRTYADPQVVFGLNSPSVPEPGVWAMMLIGFAGLGSMMRSRRRAVLA